MLNSGKLFRFLTLFIYKLYKIKIWQIGRRDRNEYWERIQSHNAIVTCAVFSPKPQLIVNQIRAATFVTGPKEDGATSKPKSESNSSSSGKDKDAYVFVSAAGCDGIIKVFINKLN